MGLREIESKDESIFAWKSQILKFIYQELDHTCSYGMFGGHFKGIEEIIRRRG